MKFEVRGCQRNYYNVRGNPSLSWEKYYEQFSSFELAFKIRVHYIRDRIRLTKDVIKRALLFTLDLKKY